MNFQVGDTVRVSFNGHECVVVSAEFGKNRERWYNVKCSKWRGKVWGFCLSRIDKPAPASPGMQLTMF